MIVYVDTSALVPLLINEPASEACGQIWDSADSVVSTRLAYIEAVAALAMAGRMGRISPQVLSDSRSVLDDLWPVVDIVELDQGLMSHAAKLSVLHELRGYDATHCAAAVAASDGDTVAASGDRRLLAAWRAEGLNVRDTNT